MRSVKKWWMAGLLGLGLWGLQGTVMAGGTIHYTNRNDYLTRVPAVTATHAILELGWLDRREQLYHWEGGNWIAQESYWSYGNYGFAQSPDDRYQWSVWNYEADESWVESDSGTDSVNVPLNVAHLNSWWTGPWFPYDTNGVTPGVAIYQTNFVYFVTGAETPSVQRYYNFTWLVRDVDAFGRISSSTRQIEAYRPVDSGAVIRVEGDFGGTNQVIVVAVHVECASDSAISISVDPNLELGGSGSDFSSAPPSGWMFGPAGRVAQLDSPWDGVPEWAESTLNGDSGSSEWTDFMNYMGLLGGYVESHFAAGVRQGVANVAITPEMEGWETRTATTVGSVASRCLRLGPSVFVLGLQYDVLGGQNDGPPPMVSFPPLAAPIAEYARAETNWFRNVSLREVDKPDYLYLAWAREKSVTLCRRRGFLGTAAHGGLDTDWEHRTYTAVVGWPSWLTVTGGQDWSPSVGEGYEGNGTFYDRKPLRSYAPYEPNVGELDTDSTNEMGIANGQRLGFMGSKRTWMSKVCFRKRSPGMATYDIILEYHQYDSRHCSMNNGAPLTASWRVTMVQNEVWQMPPLGVNWAQYSWQVVPVSGDHGPIEIDPCLHQVPY